MGRHAGRRTLMNARAGNFVEGARDLGLVLTSFSGLTYAGGYLVMRGRANALGTDPGFTLVDQSYVLAGFRFAVVTVIALVVVAPLVMLVTSAARRWCAKAGRGARRLLEWIGIVALAVLTLQSFSTLEVRSVLLDAGAARAGGFRGAVAASVLGLNDVGVLITLAATFVATMTVLWARARMAESGSGDAAARILLLLAFVQLALLPIQHGIFYADRNARMLSRIPEGVSGVVPPVWVLDRGAERASLLAHSATGEFCLVTVKVDALDGIAVSKTESIAEIVQAKETAR
jgi:hypothetical protein